MGSGQMRLVTIVAVVSSRSPRLNRELRRFCWIFAAIMAATIFFLLLPWECQETGRVPNDDNSPARIPWGRAPRH
jgi:hypothetical protein